MDVADLDALVEALAYEPAASASPWDKCNKRGREVDDRKAVQPVVLPEKAGLTVAKNPGSRGPEEGLDS